jgi:outer membrane protein, heavy metal efflux system
LRSNVTRCGAVLVCTFLVSLGASRAGAGPLSLAEARRRALERNFDLLAAKSDVDQALAQQIVAREIQNPTVSLATSALPVDGSPASAPGSGNGFWQRSYDTVVAVNQLLELHRHKTLRRAAADHGAEAARARFDDARRTLDAAVVKAYGNAVLAAENARLLEESAESLRRSVRIAQERFQSGDISSAEERAIEVEADRFDADALAAQAAARTARIAVDVLMGEPQPAGDWSPADPLDALAHAAERVAGQPARPRPDLAAAAAARARAEADLAFQKALRVPDPSLQLQYEHQPPDKTNTVGLGMSIDLPLWSRRRGEITSAQVARDQAVRDEARVAAAAAADQALAAASFSSARERWERYRSGILTKAEEVRRSVVYAYQSGGASLLALLEAERSASQVRLAAAQAAADTVASAADLAAARNVSLTSPFTPLENTP